MKIIDGGYHPSKPTIAINSVTIFILVRSGFTSTEGVVVPVSLKTRQTNKQKKSRSISPQESTSKEAKPGSFQ